MEKWLLVAEVDGGRVFLMRRCVKRLSRSLKTIPLSLCIKSMWAETSSTDQATCFHSQLTSCSFCSTHHTEEAGDRAARTPSRRRCSGKKSSRRVAHQQRGGENLRRRERIQPLDVANTRPGFSRRASSANRWWKDRPECHAHNCGVSKSLRGQKSPTCGVSSIITCKKVNWPFSIQQFLGCDFNCCWWWWLDRRAGEPMMAEGHRILHLPAYSPFFNIAGNCFSAWKAALKRSLAEVWDQMLLQPHAQRMATLTQLGEQNMNAITIELCVDSFRSVRALIPRLLRGEEVLQQHHWFLYCFVLDYK